MTQYIIFFILYIFVGIFVIWLGKREEDKGVIIFGISLIILSIIGILQVIFKIV